MAHLCPKQSHVSQALHVNNQKANRPRYAAPNFCSKACDWLGEAGGRVLGGPWRLTEPCDVTIGGATWLDQAQETAARTNQNAGPHRRKVGGRGNREPHQSDRGQGPYRKGEATGSCKSTQEGSRTRELPINSNINVHIDPERKRRDMGWQKGRTEARRAASTTYFINISSMGRALMLFWIHGITNRPRVSSQSICVFLRVSCH